MDRLKDEKIKEIVAKYRSWGEIIEVLLDAQIAECEKDRNEEMKLISRIQLVLWVEKNGDTRGANNIVFDPELNRQAQLSADQLARDRRVAEALLNQAALDKSIFDKERVAFQSRIAELEALLKSIRHVCDCSSWILPQTWVNVVKTIDKALQEGMKG